MKVRMKANAAGPRGIYEAEKVYDVGRNLAKQWIDEGYAEPLERGEDVEAEVATVAASENTSRQRGPRRAKAD